MHVNRQQAEFVLKLHETWRSMKKRCSPNTARSKYHGDRGIRVCKEWNDDFFTFFDWAIDCYKPGLTLDRIDSDGDYSPTNCRWATYETQNRNKANVVLNERTAGEIKWLLRHADLSTREIGEKYGVSRHVVGQIKLGNNWKTAPLIKP